jgi:uncharacterized protein
LLSVKHYVGIFVLTLIALIAVAHFSHSTKDNPDVQALRTLAEKGDGPSQYAMALRYEKGDGVPQSYLQVGYYLRLAATHGVHEADLRLQKAHEVCSDDLARTLTGAHECEIDAEAGHVEAEVIVGVLFDSGRFLKQDHSLAATYFDAAAIHGDSRAQLMMARAYSGKGLPANPIEEYAWIATAAQRTDLPKEVTAEAVAARDALHKRLETLGPATVERAEAKARDYILKYSNTN